LEDRFPEPESRDGDGKQGDKIDQRHEGQDICQSEIMSERVCGKIIDERKGDEAESGENECGESAQFVSHEGVEARLDLDDLRTERETGKAPLHELGSTGQEPEQQAGSECADDGKNGVENGGGGGCLTEPISSNLRSDEKPGGDHDKPAETIHEDGEHGAEFLLWKLQGKECDFHGVAAHDTGEKKGGENAKEMESCGTSKRDRNACEMETDPPPEDAEAFIESGGYKRREKPDWLGRRGDGCELFAQIGVAEKPHEKGDGQDQSDDEPRVTLHGKERRFEWCAGVDT